MSNQTPLDGEQPVGSGDSHGIDVRERTRRRMAEECIPVGSDNPTLQALGAPPLHLLCCRFSDTDRSCECGHRVTDGFRCHNCGRNTSHG